MELWGRETSINVQKVMWVLAELNLDYTRIDVGGVFGGLDDKRYTDLNPHRKIPTLVDGSVVVWESNAILRYLGDAYGRDALYGTTTAARSASDRWMEWFQNSVYQSFQAIFHQKVKLAICSRDSVVLERAQDAVFEQFAVFDEQLKSKSFVNGDQLTLADVPIGACLYRYFTMDMQRPKYRYIERYYSDLTQRSAYRDNVMISYDSLRAPD